MTPPSASDSDFHTPLTSTETLVAQWSEQSEHCREAIQLWEGLPQTIADKSQSYRQRCAELTDSLQRTRKTTQGKTPLGESLVSYFQFLWLHRSALLLRGQIVVWALLIVLHRLLLFVLIPAAAAYAVFLCLWCLWEWTRFAFWSLWPF